MQHSDPGGVGAKGREGKAAHTQKKKKLFLNVFNKNSYKLKREKSSFRMSLLQIINVKYESKGLQERAPTN